MDSVTKEGIRRLLKSDHSVSAAIRLEFNQVLDGRHIGPAKETGGPMALSVNGSAKLIGMGRTAFWELRKLAQKAGRPLSHAPGSSTHFVRDEVIRWYRTLPRELRRLS